MTISVSGLHIENSPKLREYAQKKVNKLLKFHPKIDDIKVRLISKKAHRGQEADFYCEITIHLPHKVLDIVDAERSMDKAIDKAVERAKRVLIKTKEKSVSRSHKEGVVNKILGRFRS